MRLLHQAAAHFGARAVSALTSIAVFALIARHNTAADAKTVYAFLFVTGFAAAVLRTFCVYATELRGSERRALRWARVRGMARRYRRLAPLFLVAVAGVLSSQAVPWWAVLALTLLIVAAGIDGDVLRSVAGRSPLSAPAFALGNLLALAWMLLAGGGLSQALIAIALTWLPTSMLNLWLAWRTLDAGRRSGDAALAVPTTPLGPLLLTSSYDGLILNWPFIFGRSLSPATGVDIAIIVRLFAAGQLFAPLIVHWANGGHVARFARQRGVGEAMTFCMLLAVCALLGGVLSAILFVGVSGTPLGVAHLAGFAALVLAHAAFAGSARFHAPRLPARLRWLVLTTGLVMMAGLSALSAGSASGHALLIIVLQALMLGLPAAATFIAARRLGRG